MLIYIVMSHIVRQFENPDPIILGVFASKRSAKKCMSEAISDTEADLANVGLNTKTVYTERAHRVIIRKNDASFGRVIIQMAVRELRCSPLEMLATTIDDQQETAGE